MAQIIKPRGIRFGGDRDAQNKPVHSPACKGRHCLECSTVPEARA